MSLFAESFGHKMYCCHVAIRGAVSKDACADMARELIVLIDMTPRHIFCDDFSDAGEEVGVTFFHSLLESYIAIDTYFPRFEGAYLQVCSCKPFDATKVQKYIEDRKLEVADMTVYQLAA